MPADVFAADEQSDIDVDTLRWVRLVRSVLEAEGIGGDFEVSLLFVDEKTITDLNGRFMGKSEPTDVLAFPIDEEDRVIGRSPDAGGTGPGYSSDESIVIPNLLGDVVICPLVAKRNAALEDTSFEARVALLVVHGILHLLGRDHEDDDDAALMEERERELLAQYFEPEDIDVDDAAHIPPGAGADRP